MARFLTILLIVASIQAVAQTYPITNIKISLPANPEANMADWGKRIPVFSIVATAILINGKADAVLAASTVLVTIKRNGIKVYGYYTPESAPLANFNTSTKIWNGYDAVKLIGQVSLLPAGDYELSVQFFGFYRDMIIPLSKEKTQAFSISESRQPDFRNEKLPGQQVGAVTNAPNNKQRQNNKIPVQQPTAVADAADNRQRPNKNGPDSQPGVIPGQTNSQPPKNINGPGQQSAAVADPANNSRAQVKDLPGIPARPVADAPNGKRPPGKNSPDSKPGTVVDPKGNKTPPNKNNPDPQTGVVVEPANPKNGLEINISSSAIGNIAIGLFKKRNTPCGIMSSEAKAECTGANPLTGLPSYKVTVTFINSPLNKVKQCPAIITDLMIAPGGDILSPGASFPIAIESNETVSISFGYAPPPGELVNPTFTFTGTWGGNKSSPVQVQAAVTLPGCITCDCGEWGPLLANDTKYEAGNKISWKCGREFEFAGDYHCSSANQNCAAVTSWEIQKDAIDIKTGVGASRIKDSFTPRENGTYTLTLNASCNGIKCRPISYSIVVEDCKTCDCGEWSSSLVSIQHNGKTIGNVACGETAPLKMGSYTFDIPGYVCKSGDNNPCLVSYNWSVSGGDADVSGAGKSISYSFTRNGIYTLTIVPVCGDKKCAPCIFTIKVDETLPPVITPPTTTSVKPETTTVVVTVKKSTSPDTSLTNAKYYYELDRSPTYPYAEISGNVLNVQYINDYAAVENIKLSVYDVASGTMLTSRALKPDKLNSITGLNRLSIALNNYKIEAGRLYLFTVSVFSGNYHINFKVINNHAK